MPPNPRDQLTPGQLVPLTRVREVVEDALARELWGKPTLRQRYAEAIVARLERYRLLAPDVERSPAIPPYTTAAEQKPMVDQGWLPPHRVERLREYVEHLRQEGWPHMTAHDGARVLEEILNGGDPEYG